MKKLIVISIAILISFSVWAQTQIENSDCPIWFNGKNVGIGWKEPTAQLSLGIWNVGDCGALGGEQLTISGLHNSGANMGGIKLLIEGYDNDGSVTYPIFLKDENSNVDFWIKNRSAAGVGPKMYFAGNFGLGDSEPWANLSISSANYPLQLIYKGADAIANQSRYYIGMGNKSFSLSAQQDDNKFARTIMNFKHNGNVGIGTSDTWAKLTIDGTYPLQLVYNEADAIADQSKYYIGMGNKSFSLSAQQDDNQFARTIMNFQHNGNVGIGTSSPAYKLDVRGTIRATEIKVEAQTADFVFEEEYQLRPLKEVEQFARENKHLPEIPSAKEMKKEGVNVAEMNKLLLQKVEELTLYVIELKKENTEQNYRNQKLEELVLELKEKVENKEQHD